MQALGKDLGFLSRAVGIQASQYFDLAGIALSHKQIAVGRGTNQAGSLQVGGIELHLEAGQGLRHRSGWPFHHIRAVIHG